MTISHVIQWELEAREASKGGGTYIRTDRRTYGRTYGNSPLCPTGHRPFGAAAQKEKGLDEIKGMKFKVEEERKRGKRGRKEKRKRKERIKDESGK